MYTAFPTPMYLQNTILANNTGSDCASRNGTAFSSNVANLIRTNDMSYPCPSPSLTSDPKLSSLANNGGPTQTMALQASSPAIDAGNNSVCADALTVNDKDQRGMTRPQGPHCDIGAYEYGNIEVYIGGNLQESYKLGSSQSTSGTYANVNNGPVQIVSMNNTPIIASERVAYSNGSAWTSFAELMGLPQSQLTTTYVMPWYNNVDLNSQLRFGNVGSSSTTITVSVGGVAKGSYTLAPSQSTRVSYVGLNNGPVVVQSSGGVPIIASERVAYTPDGGTTWTSFAELMGLPSSQLTTTYVMPWYNNVDLNSQLRFGNVGSSSTTITVYVAGVVQGSYTLAPNQSTRISYTGLNNGPVVVQSSGGVPIIASERVAYTPDGGTTWTSFSELMGLPSSQLTTKYVMPIYDNVDVNDQLRFGNVGSSSTTVTVTVGGVVQGSYTLAPSQSTRISYTGLNNGPMVIQSSGSVPIIASKRVAYSPDGGTTWTSFAEMMGLPASQLSTTYVLPWYNNVDLNSQLRFGVP